MTATVDVLAIDDDKFVQKLIRKTLEGGGLSARTADDGEAGLQEVLRLPPDIILLDVEMPGINGYEVCDRLRNTPEAADIPVVFLSSHSSLRERLQGYEVGADDYLIKPFEPEHLLARIGVLVKYREERKELRAQYELAQKTAILAMTGTSELSQAMHFLEKSLGYQTLDDTARGLFETTDRLSLDCCLLIDVDGEKHWYSSQGAISPLEKELIEMSDRSSRFMDFGQRTLVNFPHTCLLVKNMPLEDMERYGRVKDLLPILLSAANTKINALSTQSALVQQSADLLQSFSMIRSNLYYLASTLVSNRDHSQALMNSLVHDLNYDLLRMGLEEDQEEFLLNRIDTAIEEAMVQMDAGPQLAAGFRFVLDNMQSIIGKQENLLDAFTAQQATESEAPEDDGGDIELF